MDLSGEDVEKLRPRIRFKVCYEVGFACPDVDDIVQEAITRLLVAVREGRIRNTTALGAFLNGICRNVISEYRRRSMRDEPMDETVPDHAETRLPETEMFEMREAIARGMDQLSPRDRRILRAFYLEEKDKDEILRSTGMTDENFRVALHRAKERFREIYRLHTKHPGGSRH